MLKALCPLVAIGCVVLMGEHACAADTPSNMDAPPVVASEPDPLLTARQLIQAKQWPQALAQLTNLLPRLAGNADVHNLLGYAYRKQATPDVDKAIEHYRRALSIDPAHRGAHEYIGEAWLMLKQPDKAREHLDILRRLCGGTDCEEYRDLAQAVNLYMSGQARQ